MRKKKLRLGGRAESIEFYSCVILVYVTLLISVQDFIYPKLFFISITSIFIFAIVRLSSQKFAVIELKNNEIILKRLFHKPQKYNKKELGVRCAMLNWGSGLQLYPCFMIGEFKEKHFYFDTGKRIYKDYFLIVVDSDNKREIVLDYFNCLVELPNEEMWEDAKNYYKKTYKHLLQKPVRLKLNKIQQFYDLIEKYNNTLMLNGGTKDENSGQSDAL